MGTTNWELSREVFDECRRPISKYFISCQCGIGKGVWLRLLAAFAFSTSGLQT